MILFAAIIVQIGLAGYGAFYAANKLEDEGSTIDEDVYFDGFGPPRGVGVSGHPPRADLHGDRARRRYRKMAPRSARVALPAVVRSTLARVDRLRAAVPGGAFSIPSTPWSSLVLSGWVGLGRVAALAHVPESRGHDGSTRARVARYSGCVLVLAADEERRRDACVRDVHGQALGCVREVVAVVHPDAGIVRPERELVLSPGLRSRVSTHHGPTVAGYTVTAEHE